MKTGLRLKVIIKIIIPFLSLFCLTSCTNIIAFVLGINTDYTGATKEQVISYAKRYHYSDNGIYTLTRKATDSLRSNPYKPGWEKGERPIQFKIFDGHGKLITFYASCEGPYAIRNALDSFPTKAVNYTDPNWTLDKEIQTFKSLSDSSPFALSQQKTDMYIVVYWATYLGSVDRNLVRKLKAYQRKYSGHKIELILVNNDLIEGVNYHSTGKKLL